MPEAEGTQGGAGGWGVDGARLCKDCMAFAPRKMGSRGRVWGRNVLR